MLIYEYDSNVFPLSREGLKRTFDRGVLGFGVNYEVVLLTVWRIGDVL